MVMSDGNTRNWNTKASSGQMGQNRIAIGRIDSETSLGGQYYIWNGSAELLNALRYFQTPAGLGRSDHPPGVVDLTLYRWKRRRLRLN